MTAFGFKWLTAKRDAWQAAYDHHVLMRERMLEAAVHAKTAAVAAMCRDMAQQHEDKAYQRLTDVEEATTVLETLWAVYE
jgi:hypothetical protein